MEQLQQSAANEEFEIKAVLHDGWTISVRAKVVKGGAGLLGSADISRGGVSHYRLTSPGVFDTHQQLIAVMVAKADKWVALQAPFAPTGV
ncbi:hypothetical protein QTI66_30075 [Variovorax sp. J22R133]|uniref:hypothetical protein n=1 Tax=Variovorax brevis TaxID=3053503 RepID=UPI002574F818|nr:hypothetical protein [Variovorax sp. J22R133]MDM0116399.1 hypothetical protein [Variovorax sp. J22R133]